MPTLRKDKDNCWMARVVVNSKQIACKMFSQGKKYGPEWRAAKAWEEEQKEKTLQQQPTVTGLERLLAWGETYLAHVERTFTRQTFVEKKTIMESFFIFCNREGITALEAITKPKTYNFLASIKDEKGANASNKYRKNLLAAWNWGIDFVESFPQTIAPFGKVSKFAVDEQDRYVPPESDVIKVLEQSRGQDLVMLLTFYYTGARRNEVFRLTWTKDVHLDVGKIRLTDHKAKNGAKRVRWLDMHPELVKALSWWQSARPCVVDNVFMQDHCPEFLGLPYKARNKLMARFCERAGVKPFGFHAMRHKSAAITFMGGGLSAAQTLMGHYRATTTDKYIRSAGLYGNQGIILDALGYNDIGQASGSLLEKVQPREGSVRRAVNCNLDHVTDMIQ